VPYNKPIPEKKQQDGAPGMLSTQQSKREPGGGSGLMGAWIQAEKMVQVALVLPCAGFIGWVAGIGLDRLLHQTWISIAGAVFGIVAGLIGVIRMAIVFTSASGAGGKNGNGAGRGDSNTPP
jgi:ATP synthase protein I